VRDQLNNRAALEPQNAIAWADGERRLREYGLVVNAAKSQQGRRSERLAAAPADRRASPVAISRSQHERWPHLDGASDRRPSAHALHMNRQKSKIPV